MKTVDLLVTGADELATPPTPGPRRGADLDDLTVIRDAALAIDGGRIAAVGTREEVTSAFTGREELSARGCTVLPGFVDAHTHPLFVRTREREFDQRVRGTSYEEITRQGGGIFSSVEHLRGSSDAEIELHLRRHLDEFVAVGTTTVEAKSGYGLLWDHELRCLEILRAVAAEHAVRVEPTFLGAHQCPVEYKDRRREFVDLVAQQMIPEVSRRGLARYCDVFCDFGAFDVEESRRILEAGNEYGLRARVHAEELGASGGAELACDVRAATADHLVHLTEATMERMGETGVQPVLLPGTVFSLGLRHVPPARTIIDKGLPVVLATDFNPGTSFLQSPLLMIALACQVFGMTVAEGITAATANAAASLGLARECGALLPGLSADAVLIRGSSHLLLGYRLTDRMVHRVIARGRVIDPWSAR